jgi:hypothetical protein
VAVIRRALATIVVLTLLPTLARAQSISGETDVTIGRSTDGTTGAAVQARLFGANRSDWRLYLEGTWGLVTGTGSDAFGAAYPYDRRVRPMELFVEKMVTRRGLVAGLRGGRYRTPFGISGRSDHAYGGFTRAPLIRYGSNYALSNTFLEAGGSVLIGSPRLTVETSLGVPSDEGGPPRGNGVDTVVRAQGYVASVVAGVSYMRAKPANIGPWAVGQLVFRGVDARWMSGGVQLRGEWIDGRPFDGVTTRGGYVDLLVSHERLGPVMLVARAERLDYDAGEFSVYPRRLAAGARIRLHRSVTVQAAVLRNLPRAPGNWDYSTPPPRTTELDVAVTFSRRF